MRDELTELLEASQLPQHMGNAYVKINPDDFPGIEWDPNLIKLNYDELEGKEVPGPLFVYMNLEKNVLSYKIYIFQRAVKRGLSTEGLEALEEMMGEPPRVHSYNFPNPDCQLIRGETYIPSEYIPSVGRYHADPHQLLINLFRLAKDIGDLIRNYTQKPTEAL